MEGITPEQLAQIQQQCIFCQIATGKVPAKKVYEDEHVIAVLDINPANIGHVLVVTKKHYFVMPQIPDDEVEYIGKITKQLSQVVLKALQVEGTSIFIANGVAAGQKAQHFMLHIIPRKQGDEVGLTIPQRQVSDEDYEKIHKALLEGVEKHLGKITGLEKETEVEEMEEKAEEAVEEAEVVKEEETKPKIVVDKTKKKKKKSKKKSKKKKEVEEKEPEEKEESEEEGEPSLDDIAKVLGA